MSNKCNNSIPHFFALLLAAIHIRLGSLLFPFALGLDLDLAVGFDLLILFILNLLHG